jgi:hypothetical protein
VGFGCLIAFNFLGALSTAQVGFGYLIAFKEQVQLALKLECLAEPVGILRTARLPMKTAGLKESLPDR